MDSLINIFHIGLQVLNIIAAVVVVISLFLFARTRKVKSMSYIYYLLSLAFVLFLCLKTIEMAQIVPQEAFEWDVLKEVTSLMFMLTVLYVFIRMKRTLQAHEELIKIKSKRSLE